MHIEDGHALRDMLGHLKHQQGGELYVEAVQIGKIALWVRVLRHARHPLVALAL